MLTRENRDLVAAWEAHLRATRSDLPRGGIILLAREYASEGRPVPLRPRAPELPSALQPGVVDLAGLGLARRYFRRIKGVLMADLVSQPSARPTNKVLMAGGGVSVAALLWLARKLGLDLAPADAEIIIAAIGVALSYFVVRDQANVGPRSR